MRWYRHVLRRDNGDILRRALDFEVAKRRGRGQPNMMRKRQVEKHTDQIGLKKKDAIDRAKYMIVYTKLSRTAPINSRLNVVVRSPALFGSGRNGCWPSRGSQLPRALPLFFRYAAP